METHTIQPALTQQQWADWQRGYFLVFDNGHAWSGQKFTSEPNLHALAALALHGQPFGFTKEDVANLRAIPDNGTEGYGSIDDGEWFRSLITRIAALLPPDE